MSSTRNRRPNPIWFADFVEALYLLSEQDAAPVCTGAYRSYRKSLPPDERFKLPATSAIYRHFGSWNEALCTAGIETARNRSSRCSDEALVDALQEVARALKVSGYSTTVYEQYRIEQAPSLPSASVVRKWLGGWSGAMVAAGLQYDSKRNRARISPEDAMKSLQRALSDKSRRLSEGDYQRWLATLPPSEKRSIISGAHIKRLFGSWEDALQAAGIRPSESLHTHALWGTEEIIRIAEVFERVLGHPVTEAEYHFAAARNPRPMPSWKVFSDLSN